jgi:hypothetical protein
MRSDYPWVPRLIDMLKQNVDLTLNDKPGSSRIDDIVKDHEGKLLCILFL